MKKIVKGGLDERLLMFRVVQKFTPQSAFTLRFRWLAISVHRHPSTRKAQPSVLMTVKAILHRFLPPVIPSLSPSSSPTLTQTAPLHSYLFPEFYSRNSKCYHFKGSFGN